MENNKNGIVSAIIIAGVLIAGAILLKGNSPKQEANTGDNTPKNEIKMDGRAVSKDDHIIGRENAKIVIVEYSDIDCPYCKVFHNTMQRVLENSTDIAWVFRHYPIPQLHPDAYKKAESTECAWEQGGNEAFWKYTDKLFGSENTSLSELPKIATSVGLDVKKFNECLSSGKFTSKVQADIDDGIKAGVNGTPSSFILVDGKVIDTIPGAQPYESVMQRLNLIK